MRQFIIQLSHWDRHYIALKEGALILEVRVLFFDVALVQGVRDFTDTRGNDVVIVLFCLYSNDREDVRKA